MKLISDLSITNKILLLLATEFPTLLCEGGRSDKLICFSGGIFRPTFCCAQRTKSCSIEPGRFKTPSSAATSKIIQRATGPYLLMPRAPILNSAGHDVNPPLDIVSSRGPTKASDLLDVKPMPNRSTNLVDFIRLYFLFRRIEF